MVAACEQNPADGLFYVSIPELKKDEKKGGVAVIDPKKGKLVKMLPVENCHANGLAFGITAYALLKLLRGKLSRADWLLLLLAGLFVARFAWLSAG